jgi:AcrR family transcriptional regulator
MTDATEQKILESALKLFAEKGYKGATTRLIANETGFTEVTIYRKFKNKDNLFRSVLIHYNEKMMKEINSIFVHDEFESKRDFLDTLVYNLVDLGKNNFEFIQITINDNSKLSGNFLKEFVDGLSVYVEKNIQNDKIDYRIFLFSIISFVYFFIQDYGIIFPDQDKAIENFIDNLVTEIK